MTVTKRNDRTAWVKSMHRSKVRKLLYTSFLQFTRTGAMFSLYPIGVWWPPPTDFDTDWAAVSQAMATVILRRLY